jgi:hypothetical protein
MITDACRTRSWMAQTAAFILCSLTSGCGIGCLFVARSNSLDISATDHPGPDFKQVIKDAISPFGFVGSNPNDPGEVNFYVGHGGLRFPPPANTVDIAIDTTTDSVRLVDFGNRESKFDRDVMDSSRLHVESAYG